MKEQFEKVICNLCGTDDYTTISQTGQFNLVTNVVLCKNCGLGYLNPRWTKESYLNFYINEYDKYYRPNIKNTSIDANSVNPIFERLSNRELLKNKPLNILDIGSGSGANLNYFKSQFPESHFHAIEPSNNAIEILTNNKINVISKDVDSDWHQSHKGKFDLIIMRHVLEHFSDPLSALKRVKSSLSDRGILYIAVPNNGNPTTPLLTNWFRVVHTYYFNKTNLSDLLIKANLSPIESVEGDQYNQGELFTFVKKNNNSTTHNKKTQNTYQKQLEIFQLRLAKEKRFIPSLKRKIKFSNQKLKRLFK